ncbi:MAG TPA: cyclic nucleotide-binding domain-containing protein [Chthoniobacterales bacterium]|jgi:CRP-like cAMP-binding protein|nr:cyclic nucleotide-binding domain-containing protein [Chthoniobacterales bacterium]
MNVLLEQQVRARGLSLPQDGLLSGVSREFIAELQLNGTFVEYNQQKIVSAGRPADYIFCVISGRVDVSRRNEEFGKTHVATLGRGQWFGERDIFLRAPADEDAFAEGEVILWTVPPDTLRDLFFGSPGAVRLLFNFGVLLAQKLSTKPTAAPQTTGT